MVKAGGIDSNEWFEPVWELFVGRRRPGSAQCLARSNLKAILKSERGPMNTFQDTFDAQKALFATGVTRTYEWRIDQLDRMARMIKENEVRFQKAMAKDFKTASQEYIFETAASAGETEVQKSQLR